jgi:hypothetical protein
LISIFDLECLNGVQNLLAIHAQIYKKTLPKALKVVTDVRGRYADFEFDYPMKNPQSAALPAF